MQPVWALMDGNDFVEEYGKVLIYATREQARREKRDNEKVVKVEIRVVKTN